MHSGGFRFALGIVSGIDNPIRVLAPDLIRAVFNEKRVGVTDTRQLGRLQRSETVALADAAHIKDFFQAMPETAVGGGAA